MPGLYLGNVTQSALAAAALTYTALVATPDNTVTTTGSAITLVNAGTYRIGYSVNVVATTDGADVSVNMTSNTVAIANSLATSTITTTGDIENLAKTVYVDATAGTIIAIFNASAVTETFNDLAITVEKLS
jgi:hypothetical protein